MTTLREAAKQALEALQNCANGEDDVLLTRDALAALRAALVEEALQKFTEVSQEIEAALAEPVQEPVANDDEVICPACCHQFRAIPPNVQQLMLNAGFKPPFTAPPQRPAKPVQEPVCAHGVGKTKCSFCSVEDKQPVQEPVAGRAFLERILAAMEGVIDVADRKTDEFDALRSCVIDLTLMLHTAPPQRPAEPVQEPVAWLIEYENDEREVRFVAGTRGMRQTPLYTAR